MIKRLQNQPPPSPTYVTIKQTVLSPEWKMPSYPSHKAFKVALKKQRKAALESKKHIYIDWYIGKNDHGFYNRDSVRGFRPGINDPKFRKFFRNFEPGTLG